MRPKNKQKTCNAMLKIADAAFKRGDYKAANAAYAEILTLYPANQRALSRVQMLNKNASQHDEKNEVSLKQIDELISKGNFTECISLCNKIISERLNSPALYKRLAKCYYEIKDFDRTIEYINLSLKLDKKQPDLLNVLGTIYQKQSRFADAILAYQNALVLSPNFFAAQHNLAVTFHNAKDYTKALSTFRIAASLNPEDAILHCNIANLYRDLGNFEKSKEHYSQSLAQMPNFPEALNNLGMLHWIEGNKTEAFSRWRQGHNIAPKNIDLIANIGMYYWDGSRPDLAESIWRQALEFSPNNTVILAQMCEMLEKTSNLEKLNDVLNSIKEVNDELLYYKAQLEFRNKSYSGALEIFEKIDVSKLNEQKRPSYYSKLGMTYEKLGEFTEAFKVFEEKNKYTEQLNTYDANTRDIYREKKRKEIGLIKSMIKPKKKKTVEPNDIKYSHSFLIGFPRSGTTLLDTILRSHSKVDIMEETPALERALETIKNQTWTSSAPSERDLECARDVYKIEVQKYVNNKIAHLVDKYPLHIFNMPKIMNVFPAANFILALRHPFDSILSCWSQSFKLNDAMSNFTRLDTTVELYCLAMDTLIETQTHFDVKICKIKYENVVTNFQPTIYELTQFLNLGWEDSMLDHQRTARDRTRINTPSYSQVTQPLYTASIEKWRNYAKHFEPYKSKIAKYCEKFSYDL